MATSKRSLGAASGTGQVQQQSPQPGAQAEMMSPDAVREERIRQAAYHRSAQRDFAPGSDVDDWLEAEREVDAGTKPM